MRITVAVVFVVFIAAILAAAVVASKSEKPISVSLVKLQIGILIPVVGNLVIILSSTYYYSLLGYYIYFIGMNIAVYCILMFTIDYCELKRFSKFIKYMSWVLITVDIIQYTFNPTFHQAFNLQAIKLYGSNYFLVIPYIGQTLHRVICYGMYVLAVIICVIKVIRSPKIYRERYSVSAVALFLTGLLETFYIFSRTPMDLSMTAFATYGLLVFYISLYYRPLKVLDRMLSNIASELNEALFFFDLSDKCIWANEPAMELAGVSIKSPNYELAQKGLVNTFGDYKNNGDSWSCKKYIGGVREPRFYSLEYRALNDDKGHETGRFLRIRDNTEQQLKVQREIYAATHDSLTDLYTKEYLYELIDKEIDDNPGKKYYVIFVDVNNFKIVNDVFGSAFGDYALKRIAEWIKDSAKPSWVYGRLGGDTFGGLVPVEDFDHDHVESELSAFDIKDGNKEHRLLIHFGVYEVTGEKTDVSVMFDRAHLAINRIKEDYNVHIAYYDESIRDSVVKNQMISAQLADAIATRQIIPYLQPIVDSKGKVLGAEALARWIHPTEGYMPPNSFIPVLEQNGMIADVDIHIWRCACEILKRWQDKGLDLFLSINISPKDFYFMDVPDTIIKMVEEFGIDPVKLRIEITETAMMGDSDRRMADLQRLRDNRFIIEMDDFGSGYSSLNLLQDMPVDVLKIDMAFLKKAEDNQRAEMILYNIIAMTKDLEITSLTEGVETLYQYEQLSRMGCKLFQGYHFSKPVPLEEFEKYCEQKEAI